MHGCDLNPAELVTAETGIKQQWSKVAPSPPKGRNIAIVTALPSVNLKKTIKNKLKSNVVVNP